VPMVVRTMSSPLDLEASILAAWTTNTRATAHLVRHIPTAVWSATVPGVPSRTVRSLAAHLHNSRCSWVRTLGREHGVAVPPPVDHRTVTRRQLLSALDRSSRGIAALLQLRCNHGGRIPPSKGYVWRNLALDVAHVLTYFVAHEAHHRGQVIMVARQLNCRFSTTVSAGLWDWRTRRDRTPANR
jgi:uncharacterized damage-inducible protein DinB